MGYWSANPAVARTRLVAVPPGKKVLPLMIRWSARGRDAVTRQVFAKAKCRKVFTLAYRNEIGGKTTIRNVATGPRRSDISHQISPLRPLD